MYFGYVALVAYVLSKLPTRAGGLCGVFKSGVGGSLHGIDDMYGICRYGPRYILYYISRLELLTTQWGRRTIYPFAIKLLKCTQMPLQELNLRTTFDFPFFSSQPADAREKPSESLCIDLLYKSKFQRRLNQSSNFPPAFILVGISVSMLYLLSC